MDVILLGHHKKLYIQSMVKTCRLSLNYKVYLKCIDSIHFGRKLCFYEKLFLLQWKEISYSYLLDNAYCLSLVKKADIQTKCASGR